jgi:hypothetical protein
MFWCTPYQRKPVLVPHFNPISQTRKCWPRRNSLFPQVCLNENKYQKYQLLCLRSRQSKLRSMSCLSILVYLYHHKAPNESLPKLSGVYSRGHSTSPSLSIWTAFAALWRKSQVIHHLTRWFGGQPVWLLCNDFCENFSRGVWYTHSEWVISGCMLTHWR